MASLQAVEPLFDSDSFFLVSPAAAAAAAEAEAAAGRTAFVGGVFESFTDAKEEFATVGSLDEVRLCFSFDLVVCVDVDLEVVDASFRRRTSPVLE